MGVLETDRIPSRVHTELNLKVKVSQRAFCALSLETSSSYIKTGAPSKDYCATSFNVVRSGPPPLIHLICGTPH